MNLSDFSVFPVRILTHAPIERTSEPALALQSAMLNVTPQDAAAYFAKCGYMIEELPWGEFE